MEAPLAAPPRLTGTGQNPSRLPWGAWAGAAAGLGVLGLLRMVEPAGQPYFPKCFLYATTGIQCPGCGVLRATHALLNGEFHAAWQLNPLFVLLLPILGWTGLAWVWQPRGRPLPQPLATPWGIGLVLGLAAGFGVARNLPGFPWLAP